ncbi:MAG: biotin--[acetyl-CoA-carboxylase] ligase [Vulcanimicrobiota bacterium]
MNFALLESWPELASTNDRVRELAELGAAEGSSVVADRQSGGRGRLGRVWHSPEGGLWVSTLLRPEQADGLSLLGALACRRALAGFGFECRVRWPNDLLLSGKKVAGVLVETRLRGAGCDFAVLGLGVNVAVKEFPPELTEIATSLCLEGSAPSREQVLAAYVQQLESLYQELRSHGVASLVAEANAHLDLVDRAIELELGEQTVRGRLAGLDPRGGLVLADGRVYYSAERLRPAGPILED